MARILYLANLLTQDGINLTGSRVVERLEGLHDVRVSGMVVPPDDRLLNSRLARFMVPETDLVGFDAVVMEGGWQSWGPDQARIATEAASRFVNDGGQLLICDLSRNEASQHRESLMAANHLLRAIPKYSERHGLEYLHDDLAADPDRYGFWFYSDEMVVSDWLKPALKGVQRLLVEHPIYLIPAGGIAASGTRTTEILGGDMFVERGLPAPWASAAEVGLGHVVVIGGDITPDVMVERCPDNAKWIANLLSLVLDRSAQKQRWVEPLAPRTPSLQALARERESQTLEKKSSFLVSIDPAKAAIATKEVQRWVGKSIVALANTNGGNLFIGMADDGTVVGLESDFATLKGADKQDLFEQKLSRYIKDRVEPWSSLNLNSTWLTIDGKDVLAVTVPRSDQPVHLKEDKGEVFYVRNMTSTDALSGKALVAWLRGPRWQ